MNFQLCAKPPKSLVHKKSGPLQPVGVNSYAIEGGESRFDGEQTCRLALIFLICFGGGGVLAFVLFLISPLWFKIMKCVEKKDVIEYQTRQA